MLRIKVEKHALHIEQATGNLRTICAETAVAIRGIYDAIRADDAEAAKQIRQYITKCVNSEEFWSIPADDEDEETSVRVDWDTIRKTIERGGAEKG